MAEVYDDFQQGLSLLHSGDVHAAAVLLKRAVEAEPDKSSIREACGRALFASGQFAEALAEFQAVLEISPVNDYAHFAAGLSLGRLGRFEEALGHLKLAAVMKPGNETYERAIQGLEIRRSYRAEVRKRMEAARELRDRRSTG